MTTENLGSQRITIRFNNPLEAKDLSHRFYCGVAGWKGIISGGWMTRLTNSSVSVSPMVAEIPFQKQSYRIETLSAATITGCNSTTERLILTFNYRRQISNYAEFSFVASSSPLLENQLVIGDGVFSAGLLLEEFEYSSRDFIEPGRTGGINDSTEAGNNCGLGGLWMHDWVDGKLYRVALSGGTLVKIEKADAH
jgi:hypothetical protein